MVLPIMPEKKLSMNVNVTEKNLPHHKNLVLKVRGRATKNRRLVSLVKVLEPSIKAEVSICTSVRLHPYFVGKLTELVGG